MCLKKGQLKKKRKDGDEYKSNQVQYMVKQVKRRLKNQDKKD